MTRVWTLTVCALLGAAAQAADPPYYVKKTTWYDTLLASRDALAGQEKTVAVKTPLPDFGRSTFTIMAWVRTTAGGTILAKAPAKGKWAPQSKAFFIRDGKLCYDVGMVGCVTSERTVADGKWHHVAVTRGDKLRLYIDGRLDVTGHLAFRPDGRGHVPKIGYASTNFPQGFRGDLDEVRVYALTLSDADIQAHFAKPQPAKADALVACWLFDTGGHDASGSGNDVVVDPKNLVAGKTGKAVRLSGGQGLLPQGDAAGLRDALWKLVERDFRDETSCRQIAWEREDAILDADSSTRDLAALAARYARACHRTPSLAAEAKQAAAGATDRAGLERVRALYHRSRRVAEAVARVGDLNLGGLRAAVEHLTRTCGADYPKGLSFLARIDAIAGALARSAEGEAKAPADLAKTVEEVERLRRKALVARNPLLKMDKLLFVKRRTLQSSHYYTDFIDGCRHFGGNLCTLSLKDGRVTELVPSLKDGIFGRYDLSFDGKRVVFGYKPAIGKGFRIWEVGVDGTGLRQLTVAPPDEPARVEKYRQRWHKWYWHHTDDMHPCYLPDGGICFVSTRCEFGILCDGPDILTGSTLYRMDAGGNNIKRLSNSSVSESAPTVMNDGRVLYTRWEYVDKGAVSVKCLWAMHPDGTGSVEIFGNDIAFPDTFNVGRAIPGDNNLFVAIGGPHMPLGVGTVLRLDTNYPIRSRRPMTYLTPTTDVRQEWGFNHPRQGRWVRDSNGPLFMDPYPLADPSKPPGAGTFFLVSYNPDRPWNDVSAYGLYLLDEFGNRVLIHREPQTSCWMPMPLSPRRRPPVLPVAAPVRARHGTLLMADVTVGIDGVRPGTVKYLRVLEQVPRPWTARRFWDGDTYDQQHAVVSMRTHLGLKVLHGVVPVEADGSACFTIPAGKNIFFEALDEDFMEMKRMRTFVNLMPGERRSCIGCHEVQRLTPEVKPVMAARQPPRPPVPQPGDDGPRPLHYPTDVQPVLDKHCVKCHSGAKPKAGLDLTGEMTTLFSRSYENILKRGLVTIIGENHPKTGNVALVPPGSLGSHASKLIAHLKKGHSNVKLSRTEFIKLVTWVDSNSQYYGSYYGRRNLKHKDHPNFRPVPTQASALGTCPLPDGKR